MIHPRILRPSDVHRARVSQAVLRFATLMFGIAVATNIAAAQTYTDLYDFGAHSNDPNDPQYTGAIAQGRDGNMYSTTNQGWIGGPGDVFSITPTGTLKVLHNFNGTDGSFAVGGLTLATGGEFYGTTQFGGEFGLGTIFKITSGGAVTTLYSFTNAADGSEPTAPPIEGLDGNFYGTASSRDFSYVNGCVYKISDNGAFTILHTFDGNDGYHPLAPLVQASDGNFYGTTYAGGAFGYGVIFKISSSGKFTVLHNLTTADGQHPFAPLIEGSDGDLYGVTSQGGSFTAGTAFKITLGGKLTVLHEFTFGIDDGGNQVGGLIQATDGNFCGTNNLGKDLGHIFRFTPTGTFTSLYAFQDSPQVTLLQHTNGILYGSTAMGGSANEGTFYSFDVGLGPFVRFLPGAGREGQKIEFLGQGFKGTTHVSFNGTPAHFTVESDTYLTATVPKGATTGFVHVTTPSGKLKSDKKFRVIRCSKDNEDAADSDEDSQDSCR